MINNMNKEKDFYQISLKMLLRNSKGEILILKALDNGTYASYYDLPGGRINADEFNIPFTEILEREVKEEIGDIELKLRGKPVALGRHLILASMTSLKKDIHVLYVFFEAEYLNGGIKISEEHVNYEWLDLNKIELSDYFISGILEGVQFYKNSQKKI